MIEITSDISYCPEAQAIFATTGSIGDKFATAAKAVEVDKNIIVAPWGEDNDLPQRVLEKIEVNDVVGSNLLFNIESAYGLGIKPMVRQPDGELTDCVDEEVLNFFEDNDITGFFLEQVSDMMTFFNVFPQVVLSGDRKKIVGLYHLEAAFSRWGSMSAGDIEITKHYYSAKWGSDSKPTIADIDVSPVLSRYHTLTNLEQQIAANANATRFVLQVSMPTPGRTYYSNAYWHSIFRSGWYDLSCMIPKNKIAILKNNLAIRTVVYISEKYWKGVIEREGINPNDKEAISAVRRTEIDRIKAFISNEGGKGGTLITSKETWISSTGKAIDDKQIVIESVDAKLTGGELVADSEEASNIISYTMGVHTSLIGATPGKSSGSLGGSDKETLFTMKQAMMRPFRDRILKPLTLIKRFNKWDENIVFAVPEFQFTTLTKPGKKDDSK